MAPREVHTSSAGAGAAVAGLTHAIRAFGHLAARLDPLGSQPPGEPRLDPAAWELTDDALKCFPASLVGGPVITSARHAFEALQALRQVYCYTSGYEFDHIHDLKEKAWLQDAVELALFQPLHEPVSDFQLLEELTRVETFERFLDRTFNGKTRFAIEGVDMLVPILNEVIDCAARVGTKGVLIGMAHRGRLNVLAHVLRTPYERILAEFKGPGTRSNLLSSKSGVAFLGDVKYHLGASYSVRGSGASMMTVILAPNPSHLEHINAVIEGMARAAQTQRNQPGLALHDTHTVLPILVHGDASFPGQGIVAETLNLSQLTGYRTGGTIHLITNNQLGFTAERASTRSTLYASDVAKGFGVPIVHVNADDPVACLTATRLGANYRQRFGKDFLIDLIGYRRQGHNEGDDPTFTQPLMYEQIASQPTVRQLWARQLVERQIIDTDEAEAMVKAVMEELTTIWTSVNNGQEGRR